MCPPIYGCSIVDIQKVALVALISVPGPGQENSLGFWRRIIEEGELGDGVHAVGHKQLAVQLLADKFSLK